MARKRPVTHITDAEESHEADTRARSTAYLISMGIRMACFVLAIVTSGWVRWSCVVGAVVLPWIAVQIANAGREHISRRSEAMLDGPPRPALTAGAAGDSPQSGPPRAEASEEPYTPSQVADPTQATGPTAGDDSTAPEAEGTTGGEGLVIDGEVLDGETAGSKEDPAPRRRDSRPHQDSRPPSQDSRTDEDSRPHQDSQRRRQERGDVG